MVIISFPLAWRLPAPHTSLARDRGPTQAHHLRHFLDRRRPTEEKKKWASRAAARIVACGRSAAWPWPRLARAAPGAGAGAGARVPDDGPSVRPSAPLAVVGAPRQDRVPPPPPSPLPRPPLACDRLFDPSGPSFARGLKARQRRAGDLVGWISGGCMQCLGLLRCAQPSGRADEGKECRERGRGRGPSGRRGGGNEWALPERRRRRPRRRLGPTCARDDRAKAPLQPV